VGLKVAVASDHAGFPLKAEVIGWVRELGHEVMDLGTDSPAPCDYPDFAQAAAELTAKGAVDRAIVLCGSGLGAAIAANKVPGARAGSCADTYSAAQGVEHDDMNVFCLGARVVGVEVARQLVAAFLGAQFTGEERHVRRLGKVKAIERLYSKVGE
jgi:ribose 5-phosphate isomerase B